MSDLYWGWVSVTSRCHTWLKKRPVEAKELSNDEKAYVEKRRQEMRDEYYTSRGIVDEYKTKVLLKG